MAAIPPSLDRTNSSQRCHIWTATLGIGDDVTVRADGAARVSVFTSGANTVIKVPSADGSLANPSTGTFVHPTPTMAGYVNQWGKSVALAQTVNTADVEIHVTYDEPKSFDDAAGLW